MYIYIYRFIARRENSNHHPSQSPHAVLYPPPVVLFCAIGARGAQLGLVNNSNQHPDQSPPAVLCPLFLDLCKIFVYFEAVVHNSTLL